MDLVFSFGNVEEIIENAPTTILFFTAAFRMLTFYINRLRVSQMLRDVHADITEILLHGNEDELAIYQKNFKYMQRLTIGFWFITSLTAALIWVNALIQAFIYGPSTIFNADSGLNVTSNLPLVAHSWYPFNDYWDHAKLIYSTQLYILFVVMLIVPCVHTFSVALMIFVVMHIELVCYKLQNIQKLASSLNQCGIYFKGVNLLAQPEVVQNDVLHNILKSCVENQIKITKFVKELESLSAGSIFLDFLAYSVMLCTLLYQASKAPIGLELVVYLVYTNTMIVNLWLYYWHANYICCQSEKISVSVYCSEWYNYSGKFKKSCLMVLAGSCKPIKMKAIFLNMDMTTFISVLRAAYSYFNIHLDKK